MKEKGNKQILTKQNIIFDLRHSYKRGTVLYCLVLIAIIILFIILLSIDGGFQSKSFLAWIFIVIYFVLILAVTSYLIYRIYKLFAPIKFEIVSDIFERKSSAYLFDCLFKFGTAGDYMLSFKSYGDYPFTVDEWWRFYTWSEFSMTGVEIEKYIAYGDEYYLILVNNKIAYVYSKRIFEFTDT